MSDYLKCACPHCGQPIEYPAEGTGQTVPCPTCEKPVMLVPANLQTRFGSIVIPPVPFQKQPKEPKLARTNLSKLSEETIRAKTKKGETPLHRAARIGRIYEIPRHLLKAELFMEKNINRKSYPNQTPLHIAAQHGHLDQIPLEFLTKETLSIYDYNGNTPLHIAAHYDQADKIPKELLTPEFLSISHKSSYGGKIRIGNTVLHDLAFLNQLEKLPRHCVTLEMWRLKNHQDVAVQQFVEARVKQDTWLTDVRAEPATEKQKVKLRYFGCTWSEDITKGQASDALDKCVRDFPEINQIYYKRPATEEQLAKVREINEDPDCGSDEPFYDFENEGPLTYGNAKDLIREWGWLRKTEEREDDLRQNLIELTARTDFYPSLTVARVSKAAKALDEVDPEWMEDKNRHDLLMKKVAELNPALAANEGWPTEEYKSTPESMAKAKEALDAYYGRSKS